MTLFSSKMSSPAYAILYHSIVVLLKEKPRKYRQLKKLVNDTDMLPELLHRMLDAGDITVTNLKDGLITDSSEITLA